MKHKSPDDVLDRLNAMRRPVVVNQPVYDHLKSLLGDRFPGWVIAVKPIPLSSGGKFPIKNTLPPIFASADEFIIEKSYRDNFKDGLAKSIGAIVSPPYAGPYPEIKIRIKNRNK